MARLMACIIFCLHSDRIVAPDVSKHPDSVAPSFPTSALVRDKLGPSGASARAEEHSSQSTLVHGLTPPLTTSTMSKQWYLCGVQVRLLLNVVEGVLNVWGGGVLGQRPKKGLCTKNPSPISGLFVFVFPLRTIFVVGGCVGGLGLPGIPLTLPPTG